MAETKRNNARMQEVFSARFVQWLLSLAGIAFIAWAPVVWNASSNVGLIAQLSEANKERIDEHEKREWHEAAGRAIAVQTQKIEHMQATLDELNKKVDLLTARVGIVSDPRFQLEGR